jgi:hypothetical protein
MRRITLLALCTCIPALASAQGRSMLFSINTVDAPRGSYAATLEGALSHQGFEPASAGRYEQTLSAQAGLPGRFVIAGRAGVAQGQPNARGAGALELLREVGPSGRPLSMFVGIGGGVDFSHTQLATVRMGIAHKGAENRLQGNVLFEKPLASDRDAVDVVGTVGWLRRVSSVAELGIEAVGQDLEGFWEADEAEGGARLLVGPTLALAPSGAGWRFIVGGGLVVRATTSDRTSGAERPLSTTANGYVLRAGFGFGR